MRARDIPWGRVFVCIWECREKTERGYDRIWGLCTIDVIITYQMPRPLAPVWDRPDTQILTRTQMPP
jgi:hypothetical protein